MTVYLQQFVFLLLSSSYVVRTLEDASSTHYLLYSVKPNEGFNFRRDVYLRAASLVRDLNHFLEKQGTPGRWVLVVLPWPHLPHWTSRGVKQANKKWEEFFDMHELNKYVPVVEFDEYVEKEGRNVEEVMWLQKDFYPGWNLSQETVRTAPCFNRIIKHPYKKSPNGGWRGAPYDLEELTVQRLRCVSVLDHARNLLIMPELLGKKSVLIEYFNLVMHADEGRTGGKKYWKGRSSMVYAKHLKDAGNAFMRYPLNYYIQKSDTELQPDINSFGGTFGGPFGGYDIGNYLAVHLRRQDFKHVRPRDIPSLEGAANQIKTLKMEYGINVVFLTTDAPMEERENLTELVGGVVLWYTPSEEEVHRFGDGGVAIINQWIAAHAAVFIGSYMSTFSYRICEDRILINILTLECNVLCGKRYDEYDYTSCSATVIYEPPEVLIERVKDEASASINFAVDFFLFGFFIMHQPG